MQSPRKQREHRASRPKIESPAVSETAAPGVCWQPGRLGEFLHDGPCQHLAGALFLLDRLENHPAASATRVQLRVVRQLVESACGQLRLAVRKLPRQGSLVDEVATFGRSLALAHGFEHRFGCHGAPFPLRARTEALLLRGARELLWNAVKHARAGHVNTTLGPVGSFLHLAVEDDGVGFSLQDAIGRGTGMGLPALSTQFAALGGKVEVKSTPGSGSRIALIAPLLSTGSPAATAACA